MIAYLKGVVDHVGPDHLVIDVNGVGYHVFSATGTLSDIGVGEMVRIHTHTYVREDLLALYGFLTEGELRQFEQLLGVSGVGPKAALAVVSAVPPSAFGVAVVTEDAERLSRAQGVGKKTAQRIILELKDRIRKEQLSVGTGKGIALSLPEEMPQGIGEEAVSALMMLGYSAQEANRSVSSVMGEGKSLEDVIRDALRNRGKLL